MFSQSFARGISPSGNRHRCLKFYLTKRSDQCILAFGLINALPFGDPASAGARPQ